MTERLTDKNPCKTCQRSCSLDYECEERANYEYDCMKKLEKYETAEEEGRLVVLPCKVGDFVYKIIYQRDNFDDRSYRIVTEARFRLDMIDDIGKTIFLTREEAEKHWRNLKM